MGRPRAEVLLGARRARRAGLALAAAAAGGLLALLASVGGALAVLVPLALAPFAGPGLVLAWRQGVLGRPDATACLLVAGLPLGVIPCALVASWRGVDPAALWGVLAAVSGALALVPPGPLALARWRPSDSLLLGAALAFTVAVVAWPILRVESLTERGIAYTAYFDLDMLQHMAVAGAVARGVPPENPYVAGVALHYYWLFHLVPALGWKALGGAVSLRAVFHGASTLVALLFVTALYAVVRGYASRAGARALGLVLPLAAYSYNDLFVALRPLAERFLGDLARVSSSGVDGPVSISPLSHGYLRDFLYEPHALVAAGLGVAALWWVRSARSGPWPAALASVLGVGFDAFVGAILGLWALGLALLEPRETRGRGLAATGAILGAGAALTVAAGLVGGGTGGVRLAPYLKLMALAPAYLPLEYGPMALLGAAGGWWAWRERGRPGVTAALALVGVAVGCQFLLGIDGEEHMFVRKGVKVAAVGFVALAVLAAERLLARPGPKAGVALAAALLVALPTLAIDVRCHGAVEDPTRTTYLDARDLAACRWLEAHAPPGAIVLAPPGRDDYSLVPTFALRTLYVGNRHHATLFRNEPAEALRRTREVEAFYRRPEAGFAAARGIRYVLADSLAARRYPEGVAALAALEGLRAVFEAEGVTVYEVGS